MGRLLYLELENFKSYCGVHTVGPFDDFTCIVGPNGSGKSNMMDAISFVLGVQSKHLRSSNLKELIYHKDSRTSSTTTGAAGNKKSNPKKASVKLFYEVYENEIEGMDGGKQLIFTRSISISGVCTYYLNNFEVNYELYEKQLKQIGVLVKVRNFLVFQGDVESVASKSPLELTKLVEQISGSSDLKSKYNELFKQKEEAEEKTIVSIQNKKFYSNERKAVKEQKDEAELYLFKKSNLEDYKTEKVLWSLLTMRNTMDDEYASMNEVTQLIELNRKNTLDIETNINTLKKDLGKTSKIMTKIENDLKQKENKLKELRPKIMDTKEQMRLCKKKEVDYSKNLTRVELDMKEQVEMTNELNNDITELNIEKEHIELEITNISNNISDINMSDTNIVEYHRLKSDVSGLTAIEKTEIHTLEYELNSKKTHEQYLKQQYDLLKKQNDIDQSVITTNREYIDKLTNNIALNKDDLKMTLKQKRDLEHLINSNNNKIEHLTHEVENITTNMREIGNDRKRSKLEIKMNEAIETMKKIFNGSVYGKLIDLMDPIQKQYSYPISIAMGKHLESIVVENTQVAKECIVYLREQHIGICSFIPLDNIHSSNTHELVRQTISQLHDKKSYHMCMDLIQCDEQFKPVINYAVGSTVVCDSLKHAQKLCFEHNVRVKAVTINGHVISKSGAMTGGSIQSKTNAHTNNLSSSNRFEEKHYEDLQHKKDDLEAELCDLKRSNQTKKQLVTLELKIKQLSSAIQYSEIDLNVSLEKVSQLEQQIQLKNKHIIDMEQQLKSIVQECNVLDNQILVLNNKISTIENNIFKDFSNTIGIKNICQYESQNLKKLSKYTKLKNEIIEKIAILQAKVDYENQKDYQQLYKRLKAQIKENDVLMKKLIELDDSNEKSEEELFLLKKKIQGDYQEITNTYEELNQQIKDMQMKRNTIIIENNKFLKQQSTIEITIERTRNNLHQILKKSLVDEISLPVVDMKKNVSNTELHSDMDLSSDASSSSGSSDSNAKSVSSASMFSNKHRKSKGLSKKSMNNSKGDEDEEDWIDDDDLMQWTGSVVMKNNAEDTHISSNSDSDSMSDSNSDSVGSSTHFSQTHNKVVLCDKRKAARVDLSSVKKLNKTPLQMKERVEQLDKLIVQLKGEIATMQPNLHALEKYEDILEKLKDCNTQLDQYKEIALGITKEFDEVKTRRRELFQQCYTHISTSLSVIYKDLTRSSKHPLGGNAYLTLDQSSGDGNSSENTNDEPYLGGIRYTAMPPMKRFRDMEQLSGGEKTVAALALLFSIHSYRQAPFFVLDEIDAALDNVNVKKVCNYIRHRSKTDFQCIVISLKDIFFEHADSLIGICKDTKTVSSQILSLKLSDYDQGLSNRNSMATTLTGRTGATMNTYGSSQMPSYAISPLSVQSGGSGGSSMMSDSYIMNRQRRQEGGSEILQSNNLKEDFSLEQINEE